MSYNALALLQEMNHQREQQNIDEALRLARDILKDKPRNRSVLERLTSFFIDTGCLAEAEVGLGYLKERFRFNNYWYVLAARIAELDSDYAKVLEYAKKALDHQLENWQKAIVYNILGRVYTELGDIELAAENYLSASELPDNPGSVMDYSNYIFTLHYREFSKTMMFRAISNCVAKFKNIHPYVHKKKCVREKIRIGYISPDFCYHIVAFFSYAMLKSYDRTRIEVYAYANCQEDAASQDLAAGVDVWRNIKKYTYEQAANIIYNDDLDILMDLSGHTANNCLPIMAYKPAPVQISGIGWFNTTGLPTIDYFLGDIHTDPVGLNDEFFTEKILRMSNSHFCYMWHDNPPAITLPPYCHNRYITLGCMNNFAKVTDEMLFVWGRILERLPKAKIFLKSKVFDTELGREKARKRILRAGIPLECVEMEGYSRDYLRAYAKMDIALDTYPYQGGGTTCDALYMGVPVITLIGNTHNSRFGYSILKNVQLESLCAKTESEYIEICCRLAHDEKYLIHLRQNLRRKMRQSPIMDSAAYMLELEQHYERIVGTENIRVSLAEIYQMEEEKKWDNIIFVIKKWLAFGADRGAESILWGLLGKAYLSKDKYGYAARAKYCLKRALADEQVQNRLELLCYLSEAAEADDDFVLRYESSHEAAQISIDDGGINLPAWWRWNIHSFCAHSAIALGLYDEAEHEYGLAAKFADTLSHKLQTLSSYLLVSHYKKYTTAEIWERQKIYAEEILKIRRFPLLTPRDTMPQKLRVGYISPDLRKHAMFPILYAMFVCANHDKFVVIGYQLNNKTDEYTEHLKSYADEWYNLSDMSSEEAAAKIRNDNVDLLVDLASHSRGTGLPILAYHPGRVQISGLGSLCATGTDVVDYYITDPIVDPPGMHDAYYKEKLLYLPAQFSYTGKENVPEVAGTPCIDREYIQLGCFQAYRKISDDMLLLWKDIMSKLPNARLLLKSIPFASDSLVDVAYERLQTLGLPMDRIAFEAGDDEYMERCLDIDIMLDTYPYTGGRTTLDALYMGVPVVSMYGERRNTRFGLSILNSVGMPELAVCNNKSYIDTVVALAEDKELLNIIHQQLRSLLLNSNSASPKAYMKHLEAKYEQIARERIINP